MHPGLCEKCEVMPTMPFGQDKAEQVPGHDLWVYVGHSASIQVSRNEYDVALILDHQLLDLGIETLFAEKRVPSGVGVAK